MPITINDDGNVYVAKLNLWPDMSVQTGYVSKIRKRPEQPLPGPDTPVVYQHFVEGIGRVYVGITKDFAVRQK